MNLFEDMSKHPGVKVVSQGNGLYAANFTRSVFRKGLWDEMTLHARGLFLDKAGHVYGRGYEKFFDYQGETLHYPLTASIKQNGYLAIMFAYRGELLVYSKSGDTAYGRNARKILLSSETTPIFQEWCGTGVSLLFEILDPRDPHIIKRYSNQPTAVFLDQINNETGIISEVDEFPIHSETIVKNQKYNLLGERELDELVTWSNVLRSEGLVVREPNGTMFKMETPYYRKVKALRAQVNKLLHGKPTELDAAITPELARSVVVKNIAGADQINMPKLMDKIA